MDAVQLDVVGSDRSVVFVRVRTNPISQVFACFRVQWTRAPTYIGRVKYYLEEVSKTTNTLKQDIWSLGREMRAASFCAIRLVLGITKDNCLSLRPSRAFHF
jgi:hypothetical protein